MPGRTRCTTKSGFTNGTNLIASSIVGSFAIHRVPFWWGTSEPCVAAVQRVCGAVCTAEIQRAVLLPIVALIQWFGVIVPALRILDERNLDTKVGDQREQKYRYVMLSAVGWSLNFFIIPSSPLPGHFPFPPTIFPSLGGYKTAVREMGNAEELIEGLGAGGARANATELSQFADHEKDVLVVIVWALCVLGSLMPSAVGYKLLCHSIAWWPGLLQFSRSALSYFSTGDPLFVQRSAIQRRGGLAYVEYVGMQTFAYAVMVAILDISPTVFVVHFSVCGMFVFGALDVMNTGGTLEKELATMFWRQLGIAGGSIGGVGEEHEDGIGEGGGRGAGESRGRRGEVDTTHERTAALFAVLLFTVSLSMAQLTTARRRLRSRSKSVRKKRALQATANDIMRWAAQPKDIDIMESYIGADEEDGEDTKDRAKSGDVCSCCWLLRLLRSQYPEVGSGVRGRAGSDCVGVEDFDALSRVHVEDGGAVVRRAWWARMVAAMKGERGVMITSTLLSMVCIVCLSNSQLQTPVSYQ